MIGNSPRSDINPAMKIGLNAVYIPHQHTWTLEHEPVVGLRETGDPACLPRASRPFLDWVQSEITAQIGRCTHRCMLESNPCDSAKERLMATTTTSLQPTGGRVVRD